MSKTKRWAFIGPCLLGWISIQFIRGKGNEFFFFFCTECDVLDFVFNVKVDHSENVMQCHIPMWLVGACKVSGGGALWTRCMQTSHITWSLSGLHCVCEGGGVGGRVHLSRPQFLHLQNKTVW